MAEAFTNTQVFSEQTEAALDATLPALSDWGWVNCFCITEDGSLVAWVDSTIFACQSIWGSLYDEILPAITDMLSIEGAATGGGEFPMIRRPFPTNIIAYT